MALSQPTNHWIKSNAITIDLNFFGDPDFLQVSVMAGTVIMAYQSGIIDYNAAHNFRQWPLIAYNTKLQSPNAVKVYARLTKSEVNASAMLIYSENSYTLDGSIETTDAEGNIQTGEPDPTYFYVYLGEISSKYDSSGNKQDRFWSVPFNFGSLNTDQFFHENVGVDFGGMFRYNSVLEMIEVLKPMKSVIMQDLTINDFMVFNGKKIDGISRGIDEPLALPSPYKLATTDYVSAFVDERYLRKDIDDTAHGNISFDQTIYATGYKTGEEGTGWLIEQDGEAIFGDLFSRGTFTVVGEALIGGNLHSRDYWSGWEDGKGWQVSKAGVAEFQEASIRHNIIIGNRGGSPKFISGFPNGIGWDLAPYQRINAADVAETKWRLEIDDINVRGQMRVYEFVISQLRGENDNVIFAGMMRVLKADPENEIIYLDTEKGVLYNPFRAGDILMVQRFGGMPSAENGYNVIKQYELRVKEAHVGSLSDGEERVDWITVEKFVGNWEDVAERDVLTRVDSLTDSTRKGIVKVTTVDEIGAPYIDVVYGMKTNPETATKVRMGNLSGVRTVNNRDLTGVWGLYAEGAVFENSTYYMQNGQTVEQNFTVLNGKLESEISTVKNDMSLEAGNILKNSSFGSNMRYWESTDEVYFIYTADGYIFADEYYTEKKRIADIVSDKGRYVLRLRNNTITQRNAEMRLEGVDFEGNKETAEDGTETVIYPQFSFALYYRPLTDGKLKVGFNGKDLYTEEQLTASDAYKQLSKYAEWDGKGDFAISYTGEILIYGVSLYNDKLADAKIYLEGRITQTAEALTVDYKKLIKDGDDAVTEAYTALIKVTAENLTIDYKAALADQQSTITQAYEDLVSTTKQTIEQDYSSQIALTAQSLTATFNENIKTTKETLTQQITDTEEALSNEIETTKTTITEAYTSAISASASELTSKYDSVLFEKDAQGNYTSKLIYQSLFKQASDRIDLCVTKESYGTDKQTLEAAIKVNADAVSAQASRIDDLGNTISSAGWITTADGNKLWASIDLEDGNSIVSYINQTATTTTINASKINLKGKVTFEMFDADTQAATTAQPDLSGYATKGDLPDLSDYLKETTIIEGGYIKTGLINTDSIFAELVKVGQFSIQSGGQLSWEGKDYFGGKEFQMKLGSSKLPTKATIPTIIHTFSSSGSPHAGIAAVLQSSTNSVAIYGSTNGWGSNWPNAAFAGYFSGNIKTTGTCQAGTLAANQFRYAFNQQLNGTYEYYAGINVDPGDYDLDNIRFRIRGGIIVGVTDDSGNVLRGT